MEFNIKKHSIRISKIIFKKLFGYENVDISFPDSNLSILISHNGLGKTTIFTFINNLFYYFYLYYENLINNQGEDLAFSDAGKYLDKVLLTKFETFYLEYRIDGNPYVISISKDSYDLKDSMFKFINSKNESKEIKVNYQEFETYNKLYFEFDNLEMGTFKISFVDCERKLDDIFHACYKDLFGFIKSYSINTQSIKNDLIQLKSGGLIDNNLYNEMIYAIECSTTPPANVVLFIMQCNALRNVKKYFDMFWSTSKYAKKLILNPTEIYKDILNREGVQKHFSVIDCIGNQIDFKDLSTGERQLLKILISIEYLKLSGRHIVLIDEPEISMHIEWQDALISTIKYGLPDSKFVLIATHSPNIIDGHFENICEVKFCDNK